MSGSPPKSANLQRTRSDSRPENILRGQKEGLSAMPHKRNPCWTRTSPASRGWFSLGRDAGSSKDVALWHEARHHPFLRRANDRHGRDEYPWISPWPACRVIDSSSYIPMSDDEKLNLLGGLNPLPAGRLAPLQKAARARNAYALVQGATHARMARRRRFFSRFSRRTRMWARALGDSELEASRPRLNWSQAISYSARFRLIAGAPPPIDHGTVTGG